MNYIFKVLNHRVAYHLYFWAALFGAFMFFSSVPGKPFSGLRIGFAFLFPWMIATYCHFYIHSAYFLKRKYLIYFGLLVLLIALFGYFSEIFVDSMLPEKKYERSGYTDVAIIVIITTGISYFRKGINQQYKMQELEARHIKSELNLLKSQVNPHFLFNTLNNLFSVAQKNNDMETANGLLKLSQLMRYMIYESNAEFVKVEKEFNYIKDYVELQKLRFEDSGLIKIDLHVSINHEVAFISPMILIPFVENAFKHGIGAGHQNQINIKLACENKTLFLKVENTFCHIEKALENKSSGFGLENVKRRLKLVYPNQHKLLISSDEGFFKVDLEISL